MSKVEDNMRLCDQLVHAFKSITKDTAGLRGMDMHDGCCGSFVIDCVEGEFCIVQRTSLAEFVGLNRQFSLPRTSSLNHWQFD